MKILYLASEDMCKEGAGNTHFMEVAANLEALGNRLQIVLPGYSRVKKNISIPNISYVPAFPKSIISYIGYQLLNPFFVLYFIATFRPDYIYIRQGLFDFFVFVLAKLTRVPLVLEVNGIIEDELKLRNVKPMITRWIVFFEKVTLRFPKKIICVTEGIRRELIERHKVDENKLKPISNGANHELFRVLEKSLCRNMAGIRDDAFVVGFIGTFAPWQGLPVFIEAAKKIKDRGHHDIKFLLVGDGEQETLLRNKVLEYGLEDTVSFIGRVDYVKVVYWINAFDVAVAPFTNERNRTCGLSPLKLYEYMACGKAIIAGDIQGVSEVITGGRCGMLFTPNNSEDLAEKIIYCYFNRADLTEMGLRGRDLVIDQYSWRDVAARIDMFLRG